MPRFDAAKLRARRAQLGLTIEELSDQTGLTKRQARKPERRYARLTDLESGAIRPCLQTLGKLCRALDCEPDSLFSGEPGDEADTRPTDLGEATDRWIAEQLAAAPPMTDRQAARTAAILFGGPGSA